MKLNSHWHVVKSMHAITSVYLHDMTKTKEAPILCMHIEYIVSLSVWLISQNPDSPTVRDVKGRAKFPLGGEPGNEATFMKTPIWSTLHHPKGTTQKGTTQG